MSSTGPAAVLEAAELCSAAGDHADAAHLLAEALITGPTEPDLLRALAGAQFAIGWDGCALALLAEAHRVAPDDGPVLTARNEALRDHGRFVEALAVLGTTPHPVLRAATYADMGLPVLAVETHADGRRGLWWRTGGPLPLPRSGRRHREERILTGLVEAAGPPSSAPVDMPALLTRIVNGTDQDRDALAACHASVEHFDAGRRAEAASVLADALRHDATHPLLLRRAARVAEELERFGPALALYRKLAVDPSPVGVLVRQATLLVRMHRLPEAVRFVETLPAETARARPLRRVVALAYDEAGLPAAGGDGVADWHRKRWWQTGGPVTALRRTLRRRDERIVTAWAPLPVEELLGTLTTVHAADIMDAAAHAADTLDRARRAEERSGEQAAVDVLTVGAQDPQVTKELARRLFLDDREDDSLARLDGIVAADPNDVDVADGRVAALTWLNRTRDALDSLEALPPAVRATPLVRSQESFLFEQERLWTLALDAIGPAATAPLWLRGRRRGLWWRTGGPLWMIRNEMRRCDRAALASWRTGAVRLLSTLDSVVPSAHPEVRAVVDSHALDTETRTMLWERANIAVRVTAGWLATAAGAFFLTGTVERQVGLSGGWAAVAGVGGAAVAYLVLYRVLYPFTRADDRRVVLTRAAPLIVTSAVLGAIAYRAGGWVAFGGAVLAALAVMATARLAAAAACRVVAAWAMRRSRRLDPRAVALTETLLMLDELRLRWRRNDLAWRRFWLGRLERIAYAVEHDLPASFGLVDPDTHHRLTDGGRGAARAVRQLKFLVAAPSSADAWRRVEEVLRHNAGALATGELGRLRRATADTTPAPARRSRRAVAAEVLRVAVFAGLPLAVVYAAQPWLRFSGTVHDWAKVIGLAWALLYVLLHLDPTLREKLGTVLAVLGQGQAPGEERPEALARFRDSARSAAP